MMAILYSVIGYNFVALSSNRVLLLVLYGATFFFSDYGPNTTTFMLPSMTFSPACRSTLNGISAASGKVGALIGATLFEPTAKKYGDSFVMYICACISLVALILTHVGVKSDVGQGKGSSSNLHSKHRKPSLPSILDYN